MQQEVVRWNKVGKEAYVENMVKRCKSDVEHLSMIANVGQQAAFSALTKSVQDSGTISNVLFQSQFSDQFSDLERAIAERFLPAVFGCEISSIEQNLFLFLARMGGLGVTNPTEKAMLSYSISR